MLNSTVSDHVANAAHFWRIKEQYKDGSVEAPAPLPLEVLPHPPCQGIPGKTGIEGQAKGEESLTSTRTKIQSKNSTERFKRGAAEEKVDYPQRSKA